MLHANHRWLNYLVLRYHQTVLFKIPFCKYKKLSFSDFFDSTIIIQVLTIRVPEISRIPNQYFTCWKSETRYMTRHGPGTNPLTLLLPNLCFFELSFRSIAIPQCGNKKHWLSQSWVFSHRNSHGYQKNTSPEIWIQVDANHVLELLGFDKLWTDCSAM